MFRLIGWLSVAATLCCDAFAQPVPGSAASVSPGSALEQNAKSIWINGIGAGFQPDSQSVEFSLGGNVGLARCGSHQAHHLALASVSYGHMVGRLWGKNHWYRGNWEIRIELFAGAQFEPDEDWIVGLTPHLRYNFATGTRWIPFIDGGAGVTATGIGSPDLGGAFQFNEQGGIGVHWLVKDNIAVTAETQYMHISNAGIERTNSGLNGIKALIGLTYFF